MQLLLPAQQQTRTSYPCNDVRPIAPQKGDKYHSAKAKINRIRRVIANNSFDLIKSDPGNVYKYMEYMILLDAAHEP